MASYGELTPVNVITGFLGSGKDDLAAAPAAFAGIVRRRRAGQRVRRGRARPPSAARRRREHAAAGKRLLVLRGSRRSAKGAAKPVVADEPAARFRISAASSSKPQAWPIRRRSPTRCCRKQVLRHHFRLSGIITTVDAVNGAAQLGEFAEAVKQVSMADRLVVTKTDLSDEPSLAALRARLRALNVFRADRGIDGTSAATVHQASDRRHLRYGRQVSRGQTLDCRGSRHRRGGSHRRRCILRVVFDRPLGLDRVRRLGQHAAASSRRRRAAAQGTAQRGRRADAGADQRGSAHRPSAEPSRTMAGLPTGARV